MEVEERQGETESKLGRKSWSYVIFHTQRPVRLADPNTPGLTEAGGEGMDLDKGV